MFRSKCKNCASTRSKRKFVGVGENSLCEKCYNKMKKGLSVAEESCPEVSVTDVAAVQILTSGGKGLVKKYRRGGGGGGPEQRGGGS